MDQTRERISRQDIALTLAWLVPGLLVFVFAYQDSLSYLHTLWSANNESYSHGYLLLGFVAYLLVLSWPHFQFSPTKLFWLPALACSALWLVAYATQVMVVQVALLPLLLYCLLASVLGWRQSIRLWLPLGSLYLALPLADVLVLPLQTLTTKVAGVILGLMGVTAYVDGFNIYFPSGTMRIIGGCSGLNYLLAALCLGLFYAHLNLSRFKYKCLAVGLAIVVALVGNWTRVTSLVLIGYYSEMQSPLVHEHGFYGWAVFACYLVAYFFYMRRVPDQPAEQPAVSQLPPLPVKHFAISLLLVCALPLLKELREPGFDALALEQAEQSLPPGFSQGGSEGLSQGGSEGVGQWQATDEPQWQPNYRGFDVAGHWQTRLGDKQLNLSVLTYLEQHQGKELIYYRNRMTRKDQQESLQLQPVSSDLELNYSAVTGTATEQHVWWFYQVGSEVTLNEVSTKLAQAKQLFSAPPVRLVALSLSCAPRLCQQQLAELDQSAEFNGWLAQLPATPAVALP